MSKFDITKHKWSDGDIIGCCYYKGDSVDLSLDIEEMDAGSTDFIELRKEDAVAIAKHFNILDVGYIVRNQHKLFAFGESTTEMDEGAKKAFNRETKEFSARDL